MHFTDVIIHNHRKVTYSRQPLYTVLLFTGEWKEPSTMKVDMHSSATLWLFSLIHFIYCHPLVLLAVLLLKTVINIWAVMQSKEESSLMKTRTWRCFLCSVQNCCFNDSYYDKFCIRKWTSLEEYKTMLLCTLSLRTFPVFCAQYKILRIYNSLP